MEKDPEESKEIFGVDRSVEYYTLNFFKLKKGFSSQEKLVFKIYDLTTNNKINCIGQP